MGELKAAKTLLEILAKIDDHDKAVQLEAQHRGGQSAHERVTAKLDRIRERMDAALRMLLEQNGIDPVGRRFAE